MAGMKAQVILPWTDRALSANARVHWAKLAKAKKAAKTAAFYLTKQAVKCPIVASEVKVHLTFHPPDRRARDEDGAVSSCKAYLDGVSLALGVDDRHFRLSHSPFDNVVKGGRMVIDLEWEGSNEAV